MGLGNWTLEIVVSLVHLGWVGSWWLIGHIIHCSAYAEKCYSSSRFGYLEPVGLTFLFVADVLFFYISRHVLNFVYKKELPNGEDFAKEMTSLLGTKNKKKK